MTRVTAEQLAEWKALAEGASDGPWEVLPQLDEGALQGRVVSPKGDAELGNWLVGDIRWAENRAFIAAARTAVPALVAEVERLRAALIAMRARDDRNGSLPIWYREQIDAALREEPADG